MKTEEQLKQIVQEALKKYEEEVPNIERLRNRLNAIGTTTHEEDIEIERLFNLLSPALQRVLVTSPVSNRDLIPVSKVATYYHVYVNRTSSDEEPIFVGGIYAENEREAINAVRSAYPEESTGALFFSPYYGFKPYALPAEVGEGHPEKTTVFVVIE